MDCCRHRFIDWIYLCFLFFPSVLDLSTFYFFSDHLTPSPPELSFTYTASSTLHVFFFEPPSIHPPEGKWTTAPSGAVTGLGQVPQKSVHFLL